MPAPYTSYAALAAEQVEGVDYLRISVRPTGAAWAAIAIHGGAIEPGTGELARQVAGGRMNHYEFAGIKASGNGDLHITSDLFDEPQCVALVAASRRVLSCHGFTGTPGVSETLIGGLDVKLRDLVKAALEAAGFTVSIANSELAGTDPGNICNEDVYRAGVQLELSNALRASFFPGGDLSRAMRDSGQRTATFHTYAAVLASVMTLALAYDAQSSRVQITGVAPGAQDTFTRTVVDDWGAATSGQDYSTSGGVAVDYQVASGAGTHRMTAVNSSRWTILGTAVSDVDVTVSVSTDVLATGGSHFTHVAGRFADTFNNYLARLEFTTAQTVVLTLRKRVAAAETLLATFATALTHAAGTKIRMRLQIIASTLKAKAWLASAAEPVAWQVSVTDTDLTAAGAIALRSLLSVTNSNTLPVTSSWDDLVTSGVTVLERSVDGVRWKTVRGGAELSGVAGTPFAIDDYEFADGRDAYRARVIDPVSAATLWIEQDLILPTLDRIWLKSLTRPFLNRAVTVVGWSEITRPARSADHEVVGRSYPVAVSDLRSSARFTVDIYTTTPAEKQTLDYVLASGDVLLIHTPAGCDVPGGYVRISDTSERRTRARGTSRVFSLPVTLIVPPGPDVVAALGTWATVLAQYATWDDVLAANPTWDDLLELVGDPSEVIVQ